MKHAKTKKGEKTKKEKMASMDADRPLFCQKEFCRTAPKLDRRAIPNGLLSRAAADVAVVGSSTRALIYVRRLIQRHFIGQSK